MGSCNGEDAVTYRRQLHRNPTPKRARYCVYCGRKFNAGGKLQRTRDHRVPKSWGGRGRRNMVAACLECNKEKGAKVWQPRFHSYHGYPLYDVVFRDY